MDQFVLDLCDMLNGYIMRNDRNTPFKWNELRLEFEAVVHVGKMIGALRSPQRELRNELKMNDTQTPPPATTVVNSTGASVTNKMANHAERPEKFNEDAGTKKFVVACFLDYKMVDSKKVISQVQDLQVLIHDIHAGGMTLSETFQVAVIIEKLPPSWVDFKNYLKHKRKEMSVEDLVVCLRIEENNMLALKDTCTPDSAKANMIKHVGSSSRSNLKGKGKDKRKNDKKRKEKSEYLAPKARIENMVNDDVDMIAMVSDVCAMISEVNLVGTNHGGWWIDTRATRHVCADKSMFYSFRAVDNGHKLYMGNSATADIKGEGDVILKMTSEKELKLTNVLGYAMNAKLTRTSFKSVKRKTKPLDMVHIDISDLKSLPMKGGNNKDEAIDKFVLYKTKVENQLGKKIKVVRSDRGGEYVSSFTELYAKHGIRHEFTALYLPQQNGIAERKNRTLKEMITARLISSDLCDMLNGYIMRNDRNTPFKWNELRLEFEAVVHVGKMIGALRSPQRELRNELKMNDTQTPPPATTVVNSTGASVTNKMANHAERPEKFNEDAGTKKFVVACFLDYKMVDSKKVISQVQDLQVLIHDIHAGGMTLSETFQVAVIIEKLPPSWVDFKNYLKHKRKEMSVEDLVVCLRIEENNMLALKDTCTPDSAKANMIKHVGSSSRSNLKGKGKDKRKNDKKRKEKSEYLAPKARIENMVNDDVDMIAMVSDVCAMISEVNLVGTNHGGWWIDTRATRHVCADKSMFYSFRAVDNGHKLYMGNSATADIKGEGDVILKMTSEKELKLTNVLGYAMNAKLTRTSFKSVKRKTKPLDMVHIDISDLKSLPMKGGNNKDEAIDKFVLYKTKVENQLGKKIKVVRSDRGGEYVSSFTELYAKHGIRHEFTALYLPQQNGIAERKNRTLKEMITARLISSGMSQDMWGKPF
nr:hypothetical protein [Tanacetum cinerariifolium]